MDSDSYDTATSNSVDVNSNDLLHQLIQGFSPDQKFELAKSLAIEQEKTKQMREREHQETERERERGRQETERERERQETERERERTKQAQIDQKPAKNFWYYLHFIADQWQTTATQSVDKKKQ